MRAETSFVSALGIAGGDVVAVLNAPNFMDIELGQVPDGAEVRRTEEPADIYLIFADRSEEAKRVVERAVTVATPDTPIWVAWSEAAEEGDGKISAKGVADLFEPLGLEHKEMAAIDGGWLAAEFLLDR